MSSTLQLGSSGPDVAAWQKTIGVPADGKFGPKTQEATQRWQAAHGLKDDGVVGPKTREKAGDSGDKQQQQPAPGGSSDFCFPFKSPPPVSWNTGKRFFGAYRTRTRKHGGCDIIKPVGEQIYAVADGVLIHEETFFYNATWYVSFQHGPYVIRYGEIMHGSTNHAKRGWTVKKGQPIAKVGQLINKDGSKGSHMLHFEMYAHGNDHTTLRTETGPYMRRSDIMNPGPFLDKWVNNLP